jgi:hypothetical protein
MTKTDNKEMATILAAIEKINHRLDKLEQGAAIPTAVTPSHPSLDKFIIAEAIVDSLFAQDTKEKACSLEPSGKPCDHCSMCNSRGF